MPSCPSCHLTHDRLRKGEMQKGAVYAGPGGRRVRGVAAYASTPGYHIFPLNIKDNHICDRRGTQVVSWKSIHGKYMGKEETYINRSLMKDPCKWNLTFPFPSSVQHTGTHMENKVSRAPTVLFFMHSLCIL